MHIDSSFPGGNITVDRMEEDAVWLHQDLRDTNGDWFYWYFRVSQAAGKTVRFHFTKGPAIGARGPAVSRDGGSTWQWLGLDAVKENSFAFTFSPESGDVLFSVTIPYLGADWNAFLGRTGSSPFLEPGTLCASRKGRPVEKARVGCLDRPPLHRAVITARHHCCETMGSFVLEGLLSFILQDAGEGDWLRKHVEFLVIPFIDKDGIEEGDQGKMRAPHDHNRDYNAAPLYAETVAMKAVLPEWSGGHLAFALDIHCPWLKGSNSNETFYLVGSDFPGIWQEQQRFSGILEKVRSGPLPFFAKDNIPFGKEWNTEANFSQGISFTHWVGMEMKPIFVSAIEVPYANAHGVEVNAESARRFGADLGRAITIYLRG